MTSLDGKPDDRAEALFTDLYELTMLQAYFEEEMTDEGVFTLFVRRLPEERNFLIACGLETVLSCLEGLRFTDEDLAYLQTLDLFSDRFLDWLKDFRFKGEVRAVPEGTPIFENEPILEVSAPLPQAQLIETIVMNQVHLQTLLASKAQRVANAAEGRPVVDFGARRIHGTDAALKAARSFYIGGVTHTSNVLAGKRYGIPVTGTMAHSYIQAHGDEDAAFRAFSDLYPETVLLVDTYDTVEGVRRVIDLARSLGEDFRVRAIRLDSGDLAGLSVQARKMLDDAGLTQVEIFASGSLDEYEIRRLLVGGAPIDGFGVGTRMGVSSDVPYLDIAYKLTEYAGKGRLKLSPAKPVLPGRKQVYRLSEDGRNIRDIIGMEDEDLPGRPLLKPFMMEGRRVSDKPVELEEMRTLAANEIARLPDAIQKLDKAEVPYPVEVSSALSELQRQIGMEVAESR